ncbi:hypothetical protein WMF18_06005 [Sorangium sp. So ce315]|uniref:hypothetical protein n=1 Tax=Sorangium sp. So ce315 TaxID=3133299 RepID=UPI003F5DE7FD
MAERAAHRVREQRQARGPSQVALAARAGRTRQRATTQAWRASGSRRSGRHEGAGAGVEPRDHARASFP